MKVEITALPNYEYQKDEFKAKVDRLRQRFFNSISPGGLAGDRKDVQPASEFSLRAEQIWKTIKENKDLDLPAMEVMVATFRCDQIAKETLSRLSSDKTWLAMGEALKSGPVSEFGEKLSSILENYLCQYDMEAINYKESIRNENRRKLEAKALRVVRPAYVAMLQHLRSIALKSLQSGLETTVRKASGMRKFEAAVDSCCQSGMRKFEQGCEDATIRQVNDWVHLEENDWVQSKENVRESLRRDIETLKSEKKAEYKKTQKELIKARKIKKYVSEGSGLLVGTVVGTSLFAVGCDHDTVTGGALAAKTTTKLLIHKYM
ncbi:hypothetical protein OIU84_001329 [Salix udensis]|uniref:GB1/RHD3-type G domain-containing protein n=1 Tax=Salix udensis TaxID=889485 RepID=A0AAD6K943_9ROSI|nr:hypothetical protein OIU84_001329 [Salix udensis]